MKFLIVLMSLSFSSAVWANPVDCTAAGKGINCTLTPIAEATKAAGKVLITGNEKGICSPLSVTVKQGQAVEVSLKSLSTQMFLLEAKDLALSLMTMGKQTVKKVITPKKKGVFNFTCGFHGGAQSKGTIKVE
ncbi:MAG: cupredoxin domain-containing protein [Bdellovibrionota bacterium]